MIGRRRPAWLVAAIASCLLAAGCSREIRTQAPPRVETAPDLTGIVSTITVPVAIPLVQVQAALERRVPRRLWSMNESKANCIPSQSVRPLGIAIELTPDVPCTIIGEATRGRLRLSGSGERLTIGFPVNAAIRAEDIGGVLAGETATGSANVALNARLRVTPQWGMAAKLDLDYRWSRQPAIEFLGQRIAFTRLADRALAGLVADLEQDLEAEVARLALRPLVEKAWQSGFTVVSLNADNPPVWLRITPQQLGVAGYRADGQNLLVDVALAARMETRVGARPDKPRPATLPAPAQEIGGNGLAVELPVLVDYEQLERVVWRALEDMARNGVALPGVGTVDVAIHDVEIYATHNRRIAVGIDATVTARKGLSARYGSANGQVWLTGLPHNAQDSAVLEVRNLAMAGDTDRRTVDLLLRLFANEQVRSAIEQALVADFSERYARIIHDARETLADIRGEGLALSITIDELRHGRVQATGAGLFLPVAIRGEGRLQVDLAQAGL